MAAEMAGMAVAAVAFASLNGANDGASLTSLGLTVRGLSPVAALTALGVALAGVPLVLGTPVASTLTARLVAFDGAAGRRILLAAIGAAVLVTLALSVRGLPTSITLALIGGIGGAGLGAGLRVAWPVIGLVLLAAAIAPVIGGLVAFVATHVARRLPSRSAVQRRVRRTHTLAFVALCLAYGANDGQKVLAVFALVLGAPGGHVRADPLPLVLGAILFVAGGALGLRRYAHTVGGGVVAARPEQAVVTEGSAAAVVLAMAAVGAPVSMTQSVAGGLVGAAWSTGMRRVRWRMVLRIAIAWVLTLPAAFLVGAVAALVLGGAR